MGAEVNVFPAINKDATHAGELGTLLVGAPAMTSAKQVSALATIATSLGTWLGTAQPVDAQATGIGATPAEDGEELRDTVGDEEEGKGVEEGARTTVAGRLCGAHGRGTAATTAAATAATTAGRATDRTTRLPITTGVEEAVKMDEDAGEVPDRPVRSKHEPNNAHNDRELKGVMMGATTSST